MKKSFTEKLEEALNNEFGFDGESIRIKIKPPKESNVGLTGLDETIKQIRKEIFSTGMLGIPEKYLTGEDNEL